MARAKNLLKPDDNNDDEYGEVWQKKGQLAFSLLTFASSLFEGINALLTNLIKTGRDAGFVDLKTSKGRPVRLILAIGEDAVAATDPIVKKDNNES